LKTDAPEGFSYYQRGCRHHFLLAREAADWKEQSPFDHPHLGEFVDFGPGPQVVHTARWPVVDRHAWIADMDDFGYPLLLGRHALHPALDGPDGDAWTPEFSGIARSRAANMLRGYAHPSCKAILFWTRRALENARGWVRMLDLEKEGRPFLSKARVLYPAQRPNLLPSGIRHKWADPRPLRVLFVGNDYESKNGRLALRVFRSLGARHPTFRFTYVGLIPDEASPLANGIDYRGYLPRQEVLSLLRESHVLFHPSKGESFGMVFLEAAASGLAVVAARGPGLEHVDEILGEHQALLVDREVVDPDEEEATFDEYLGSLLGAPERAREMGLANYEIATSGELSLTHRNRVLGELYRGAQAEPADRPLTLDGLPHPGAVRRILSSDQVSSGQRSFRAEGKITKLNFYVGGAALKNAFSTLTGSGLPTNPIRSATREVRLSTPTADTDGGQLAN
jgi:glycosyltransferase involved in cell wall biosynthesis